MPRESSEELARLVASVQDDLRRLGEAEVSEPRSPGGWSKRQILGHLIDSAANNHHRFVRAQHGPELDFPPYDPPAWVACQRYDTCAWADLIDLWTAYNKHLVHVLRVMPDERLATPCWLGSSGERRCVPLGVVVEEYLEHMRHHLAQLCATASTQSTGGAEG